MEKIEERLFKNMKVLEEMDASMVTGANWLYNGGMAELKDSIYVFPRVILANGKSCIAVQKFSRDCRHKIGKLKIILKPDKSKKELGYEDSRVRVIDNEIFIGFTILSEDTYRGALVSIMKKNFLNCKWSKFKWHGRPLLNIKSRGPEIWETPEGKYIFIGRNIPEGMVGPPFGAQITYSEPAKSIKELTEKYKERKSLENILFDPMASHGCYIGPCISVDLGNGVLFTPFHVATIEEVDVDIYKIEIPGEKKKIKIGLEDGTVWFEDDEREDGWNDSRNILAQKMLKVKPKNRRWSKAIYAINNVNIRGETFTIKAYIKWGKGNGELNKITLIEDGKEKKVNFEKSKEEKKVERYVYRIYSSLIRWNEEKFEVLYMAKKPFCDGAGIYGQVSHTVMLIGAVLSEDKKNILAAITEADRNIRIEEIKLSELIPEKFFPENLCHYLKTQIPLTKKNKNRINFIKNTSNIKRPLEDVLICHFG